MFILRSRTRWLIAAAAMLFCTGAGAEPIHFTNPAPGEPGHADWLGLRLLDITKPASQQVGLADGFEVLGTFEHFLRETFDPFADPQGEVTGVVGPGFGGRIAVSNGLIFFQPGALIGPGGLIPNGAGGDVYTDHFNGATLVGSFLLAPLGESFLGVSFVEVEGSSILGVHYGYIGFNLFERADGTHGLFATSWGYETELDTAITIIPAPGALPLLGAGALLAFRRRR